MPTLIMESSRIRPALLHSMWMLRLTLGTRQGPEVSLGIPSSRSPGMVGLGWERRGRGRWLYCALSRTSLCALAPWEPRAPPAPPRLPSWGREAPASEEAGRLTGLRASVCSVLRFGSRTDEPSAASKRTRCIKVGGAEADGGGGQRVQRPPGCAEDPGGLYGSFLPLQALSWVPPATWTPAGWRPTSTWAPCECLSNR